MKIDSGAISIPPARRYARLRSGGRLPWRRPHPRQGSFLTVGIALGSYCAYYELGWGGWWFRDPVENASLMPWLAGTALLHSAPERAAIKQRISQPPVPDRPYLHTLLP
jgi:hypothetical protein